MTMTAGLGRDTADFARTGPDALAGRLFRRFWIPVARVDDVAPGRAKPIELLGEKFTYYRGASGAPHLVGYYCAHRSTQMSTGWVEGEDIRCFYHGWKYDGFGRCLEQPAELDAFSSKVAIPGYPTREYLGLVFAFIGEGEPPPFWRFSQLEGEGELVVRSWSRNSNYWNGIENSCDQVHVNFVHRDSELAESGAQREIPKIDAVETSYGIRRDVTYSDGGVRTAHTIMPTGSLVQVYDEEAGWMPHLSYRIPIDDERHLNLTASLARVTGDAAERFNRRRRERAAEIAALPPVEDVVDRVMRGELYLHDIKRPDIVALQDAVALRAQPAIGVRKPDRLGKSDIQIIVLRKIWAREMRALANGEPLKAWDVPADFVATSGS